MGLGIGECEASFIADESVEIILTLDSAEGIVLDVHDKKGTYGKSRKATVMPALAKVRSCCRGMDQPTPAALPFPANRIKQGIV